MKVHVLPMLVVSLGLSGCKERVTYPEFTAAQATASLQSLMVSMPISQVCAPVSLVSEDDSVVVPLTTLSEAARNRQAGLTAAGLLRVEQVVAENVVYRRSTLSYAAYALYRQGTVIDFTQLCSVKLQLFGAVQVVPVNGHPEYQGVQYQVVPATWPVSMWNPAALAVTAATGYPRKVTAFFRYSSDAEGWVPQKTGLDVPPAPVPGASVTVPAPVAP